MTEDPSRTTSAHFDLLVSMSNVVGMIIIAVAFLIVLMTAVAQQEAIDRMGREDLTIGYSSAFALVKNVEQRRGSLPKLRADEETLSDGLTVLQSDFRQASERFDLAWEGFRPVAQRLVRGGCEIPLEGIEKVGPRRAAWSDAQACVESQQLSPSLDRAFRQLEQGDGNVGTAGAALLAATDKLSRAKDDLERARAKLKRAEELSEVEDKASRAFSEMAVVRGTGVPGSGVLVASPPPILQIILTFVSGLFGALLVTLVLRVYPNAEVKIEVTKKMWPRVWLGGLIAVCVYVVLLGGSAVLGSTPGMTAAGTNYMAFCAIGILAGMFSDRVAFWLSDKADTLFRNEKPST